MARQPKRDALHTTDRAAGVAPEDCCGPAAERRRMPACTCHAAPEAPSHKRELDALARIEGQVRGLRRMVESERYCVDILTQMKAVHAALREVERRILKVHLETCVHRAFAQGSAEERDRKITEVLSVFDWEHGRPAR